MTGIPFERVKKIASGHGQPTFFEITELVYMVDGSYSKLFGRLLDYSNHPLLVEKLGHPLVHKEGFFEKHPLANFLLIWLYESSEEKVSKKELAEQVALHTTYDLPGAYELIERLVEFGYVEQKKDLIRIKVTPNDRSQSIGEMTNTIYYWLREIFEKRKLKEKDFLPWEYLYINVDDQTLQKIKKLQSEFFIGAMALAKKVPSGRMQNFRLITAGMYNILPCQTPMPKKVPQ